mmetsp:Transcript_28100/g.53530  ORF Transcript_28100/g.53530 Transcript_28100/m.53530 type:complete len:193 (-) Transcript_28100:217-795(-)|eukprot:CAMPEP_0114252626 /NCGR_PEP_ID=MMETSP0058-20121206/15938_1 /TAXON_ID=36894 /ORGANISM="Pyramimonas parkeae, CCMP726" /LENGTH=192 /DNA_ID=CAMNT_0001366575 /DNA_START=80 /DNA_END=658 /DNA_ORIENTATION=+
MALARCTLATLAFPGISRASISLKHSTPGQTLGRISGGKFQRCMRVYCQDSSGKGFGNKDIKKMSTNAKLISSIDELSKASGRVAETRNVVLGGESVTPDSWEELDAKVNDYPIMRGFKAIGTGGDDFVKSMVAQVEKALGRSVPEEVVAVRPSSKGKYVSVNIEPVVVNSGEEVLAVYTAMKEDSRLKWFL